MPSLRILPAAEDDLDEIWERDEDSVAEIEAALDEIEAEPRLMDVLCRSGSMNLDRPQFETKRVGEYCRIDTQVLRLKFWDYQGGLVPYRVLYAYHPQKDIYYVLAVGHRSTVYEPGTALFQRVCRDYDALGIPSYG